jgi:leucyl-tRNA synthetase
MIVDFVCLREKLVIEIDGPIHEFKRDEDLVRTQRLLTKGFRELRFKNEEVLKDPLSVAIQITEWIANNQVVQDHSA